MTETILPPDQVLCLQALMLSSLLNHPTNYLDIILGRATTCGCQEV